MLQVTVAKKDYQRNNIMSSRLGLICLLLSLILWAGSLPLHCAPLAAYVGGVTLLIGGAFGLCLALVTRTRRPILIYLYLGLACLCLWPLYRSWPFADAWDVVPWPGAPTFVLYYFILLRPCIFLLGVPYPFARFGLHGPDPLPEISRQEPEISLQNAQTSPQEESQEQNLQE